MSSQFEKGFFIIFRYDRPTDWKDNWFDELICL